jgi:exonuclease III
MQQKTDKPMKICTWNVCLGARCKISIIKELLVKNQIDILCLQEVEIMNEEDTDAYEMENYSLEIETVSTPFKKRTLMYIHNTVAYQRMLDVEDSDSHVIAMFLPKQDICIASVYRTYQLTTKLDHHSAFVDQIGVIEELLHKGKKSVILGDFNLDHNRRGDPSYHHSRLYELWKETETRHQLLQLVDFPTWSRIDRGTLKTSVLDHVYTNNNGLIDTISELSVITSDHCPILVTLSSKIQTRARKTLIRNWRDYTKEKLVSTLTQQDWAVKCIEVEDFYDALEQKIMVVFDKLVPLEEKTIRTECYEPVSITNLKRKRKNLFLNAKRRQSAPLFQRCKELSKKIRMIEREARKKKIRDTILAGGIQGLWHGYRLAENKPRTTFPATLSNGDLHFTEDGSKAQAFADFFRRKVETITSQARINPNINNGQLQERAPDKNFFTLQAVKEAMNNLKDKTCYGFDNIPVRILKDGAEVLAPAFCDLFNLIYQQKSIPEKWRTARILPLHKKGDKSKIGNYRPIANLCSASKIFERLVLSRLLEIEKQKGTDMSGEMQHGFKKNRSTTTAALALQNIIAKAMDEDHYVAVASMDLTAAFDVLNVDLLLTRLKIMGIPNDVIQLITAWLKDRVAYVEVGSTCSEYYAVDFGSGQGSILGPVLFNYYVAPLVIEKKILTYADDNYQVVSNKCKNAAVKELEERMIEAEHWMSGSGLKVNIEKTEIVVFHRHDTSKAVIKINDIEVKSKHSMCVLGVHFDNRLTWEIHVDAAIMKSRKSLHALKTLRCYFTEIEMIKLITANVFSKLYYASMVWLLPNLKENLFKKLFSHSGQVLKIVDKNLSHIALHKKFCRSTPKIFSIYQTSMNLFHAIKTAPQEIQSVTLNDRRNVRLSFVKENKYKVGLNLVKNRLHSITNVVDKKWMDLSLESYKLECKKRIIQNSLLSL